MKAGEGDESWLRLFDLVSAEIAIAENAPVSKHVPANQNERIEEIRKQNELLGAADVLDDLRYAGKFLDQASFGRDSPSYYLVEYIHSTKKVNVVPKFTPRDAVFEYNKMEMENLGNNEESRKTVLVEAKDVEDLKQAYPNYFTDVGYFTRTLKSLGHELINGIPDAGDL